MKTYIIDTNALLSFVTDRNPDQQADHEINFKTLLGYWPDSISDFGDAVVATQWKMNRQASVVTFDKQFIKELKNISAKIHPI